MSAATATGATPSHPDEHPFRASKWWQPASVALVAYAVVYSVLVSLRAPGPGVRAVETAGFLPLYLAAGVGAWLGSGAPGHERLEVVAWRSIALGWLCSLAGASAYLSRGGATLIAAGDVLYRAYYPLLVAGFVLLSLRSRGSQRVTRQWIDAAIIVLAACTLSWYFAWGEPAVRQYLRLKAPIDGIVAYGEVAVLLAAGVAIVRTRDYPTRQAIELLGVGALAASLGDLLLVRSDALSSFRLQTVGDIMLALSATLFMLAGPAARRSRPAPRRAVSSVLPYAALATVGGLLACEVVWGTAFGAATRGLVAGAIALAGLVIARLVLAEREARAQATARQDQDRRFRALAQRSGEALLVMHEDVVTYASEAVARVFHVNPDAIIGRTLARLGVTPDSQLQLAIQTPQDGALVRWDGRVDGEVRTLETVISDRRADDAVNGLVLTTRDVSERVALEQHLLQAQKLDALGLLAGGVAHDFNNVLAAIRANADLLRHDPTGDPTHELVEIQRATERGAALCRQLLAFGRPTEGARRRFSLAAAVRDTLPMLRRVLPSSIRIEIDVRDEDLPVLADRAQVDVALLNLVLNARDAIEEAGTIVLSLRALTLAGADAERAGVVPGDFIELQVQDTGTGMDAATLARVVEPFFTTKGTAGTGLGLPMVYGFMKGIGGQLLLQSTPGSGTVVTLRFPRATGEPATLPLDARSPTERRGAGRVLVVDDDASVRQAVTRWLARSGFDVLTADDGVAALDLLERERQQVDALVSDVVMPRMNGLVLADRLRAAMPDVRIILMSGFENLSPGEGAQPLPGVTRLQKPFPLDVLVAHLQGLGEPNDQKR